MGHDQNPAVGLMISYRRLTIFFLLERAVDAVAPGVSNLLRPPHKKWEMG